MRSATITRMAGPVCRRSGAAALAALLAFAPLSASAAVFDPLLSLCLATQPPTTPSNVWSSWSLAPQVVVPLLLLLAGYLRGLRRLAAAPGAAPLPEWRVAAFSAGWLMLVLALVSPLCRMAATMAAAHMVQHVILVAVAPPLLLLGLTPALLRASVPAGWQGGGALASMYRSLRRPLTAGALYGAAIWFWHVPLFYEAALLSQAVHLAMYASLLAVGLLFWRSLMADSADGLAGHGAAALSSLVTAIHTGLLGALLTFAPRLWFPLLSSRAVAWDLTPLEDQQLAGLIMWVPMGLIYLVGGLAMLALSLGALERRSGQRA